MSAISRADLLECLGYLAEAGRPAPCIKSPDAGWVSEKPALQRLAAAMCATCPALVPCRSYGLSHPLEFGVYGHLTNGNRQTSKTTTNETDI